MTEESGQGGGSANPGDGGGAAGGIPATLFTQDQVNHFNAEAKRGAITAYFKELGFDKPPTADEMKQVVTSATEYQKIQDGQKSDVERLNGELAKAKESAAKVPVLETQLLRAQIAADAGLKSRYWKYIEGDTKEDIEASVKETLADFGGGQGGDGSGDGDGGSEGGDQGGGTKTPAPNPQQGAAGGSGGGKKASMSAGMDAYKAKHGKKE